MRQLDEKNIDLRLIDTYNNDIRCFKLTQERGGKMRKWLVDLRGTLTQMEVALRAGMSRGAYSNIENGKRDPSVSTAKKIANALGFDWRLFFEEKCVEKTQKLA